MSHRATPVQCLDSCNHSDRRRVSKDHHTRPLVSPGCLEFSSVIPGRRWAAVNSRGSSSPALSSANRPTRRNICAPAERDRSRSVPSPDQPSPARRPPRSGSGRGSRTSASPRVGSRRGASRSVDGVDRRPQMTARGCGCRLSWRTHAVVTVQRTHAVVTDRRTHAVVTIQRTHAVVTGAGHSCVMSHSRPRPGPTHLHFIQTPRT